MLESLLLLRGICLMGEQELHIQLNWLFPEYLPWVHTVCARDKWQLGQRTVPQMGP